MVGAAAETQPLGGRATAERIRPQAGVIIAGSVAALTLLGLAIRVANFDQSLFGDELSTYWIVHDRSLWSVLDHVHSDDEITPPLSFVLGWLTLKIGGAPEWVRLPSLLAGTATIPLVYLLGARTLGRFAGLVAAAVMALSPFMIYYSDEARAYSLMIALLTASALALLAAIRTGRTRWWVIYAVCSCGALYSHYTAVFPMAGQALWVLWKQRQALRAFVIASVGVVIGFAPWISGFIADNNSPTTDILSSLQPFELGPVRFALEQWSVGYPYLPLEKVPGTIGLVLIIGGVAVALAAGAWRLWRTLSARSARLGAMLRRIPAGVALVAILALSTPVGEAVFSAVGTNLLGARNLNASWPGLAVAIGGIVSAAGLPLSIACAALVVGGYAIGAVKSLGGDASRADYAGVAHAIEQRWKPGDVVVDGASVVGPYHFTPVTLTGPDVYLPQTHPEIRLGQATGDGPTPFATPPPPLETQIHDAVRRARGRTLFLISFIPDPSLSAEAASVLRQNDQWTGEFLRELPPRFHVEGNPPAFPGVTPLVLFEITDRGAGR